MILSLRAPPAGADFGELKDRVAGNFEACAQGFGRFRVLLPQEFSDEVPEIPAQSIEYAAYIVDISSTFDGRARINYGSIGK